MKYIAITHYLQGGIESAVGPFDHSLQAEDEAYDLGLDHATIIAIQSPDEYREDQV